jgi:hypothetical protein
VVVVDGQGGGRCVRAELAAGTTVAVHVDQPGQQRVSPGPASRGAGILPLGRKLASLASKRDPVTVDHHSAIGDDGMRTYEATGQQGGRIGAHLRMTYSVAALGAVGVDVGRSDVTTVTRLTQTSSMLL